MSFENLDRYVIFLLFFLNYSLSNMFVSVVGFFTVFSRLMKSTPSLALILGLKDTTVARECYYARRINCDRPVTIRLGSTLTTQDEDLRFGSE